MTRIAWIAAAGALLWAESAGALTFFDLATGDEGLLPDARSAAMARTRVGQPAGAFTGAANPALLAKLEQLVVAVGGGVLKLKETRSTPAYDSFDGFLVESIYALNDEYQLEGGAAVAASHLLSGRRVGVGISFGPLRDFQYDYSEEVRDNNAFTQPRDRLLAVNEIQSDGTVDALSLAAGVGALEQLDVGATLQVLRGSQDTLVRTRYVQAGTDDFVRTDVSDLGGVRWMAGAAWQPLPAVSSAVVYRSESTLDGDFRAEASGLATETGSLEITYPQEVSVGVAWRPRAKLRTSVRVEASWVEWSAYEHDLRDGEELDDVWDARVGIEHVFYNGVPIRFGLRYAPAPLDDEVATTAFTFGGGLDVGPLRADLAFEVANREYRFEDLFDDALFGGDTHSQKDLVEESAVSAFLTLGARFDPFGG